jgi:hypothetical protein
MLRGKVQNVQVIMRNEGTLRLLITPEECSLVFFNCSHGYPIAPEKQCWKGNMGRRDVHKYRETCLQRSSRTLKHLTCLYDAIY